MLPNRQGRACGPPLARPGRHGGWARLGPGSPPAPARPRQSGPPRRAARPAGPARRGPAGAPGTPSQRRVAAAADPTRPGHRDCNDTYYYYYYYHYCAAGPEPALTGLLGAFPAFLPSPSVPPLAASPSDPIRSSGMHLSHLSLLRLSPVRLRPIRVRRRAAAEAIRLARSASAVGARSWSSRCLPPHPHLLHSCIPFLPSCIPLLFGVGPNRIETRIPESGPGLPFQAEWCASLSLSSAARRAGRGPGLPVPDPDSDAESPADSAGPRLACH